MFRRIFTVILAAASLILITVPVTAQAKNVPWYDAPMSAAWKAHTTQNLIAADKEFMRKQSERQSGKIACTACANGFSGYQDSLSGGTMALDSFARFNVPQLHCSQSTYGTSGTDEIFMWPGIDGPAPDALEQAGILAQCVQGGSPAYFSWFYICCNMPGGVRYDPINLNISAGDQISASVCSAQAGCQGTNGTTGVAFEVSDDTNGLYWTAAANCPSGDVCNGPNLLDIMELGNLGESTIGTQWDLPKYTWTGTNGNLTAILRTTNGNGVYSPPAGGGSLGFWTMQDQTGNLMTALGTISNGAQWTWTYTSAN